MAADGLPLDQVKAQLSISSNKELLRSSRSARHLEASFESSIRYYSENTSYEWGPLLRTTLPDEIAKHLRCRRRRSRLVSG